MFRSRMLRWHTFRIVLLTSFVWIAVGFSILIFYADCWGVNCSSSSHRPLADDDSPHAAPIFKSPDDDGNNNIADDALSNHDDALKRSGGGHSALAPYVSSQVKSWKPVGKCAHNSMQFILFYDIRHTCDAVARAFTHPYPSNAVCTSSHDKLRMRNTTSSVLVINIALRATMHLQRTRQSANDCIHRDN